MPGSSLRFLRYDSREKNPCPYGALLAYNKKYRNKYHLGLGGHDLQQCIWNLQCTNETPGALVKNVDSDWLAFWISWIQDWRNYSEDYILLDSELTHVTVYLMSCNRIFAYIVKMFRFDKGIVVMFFNSPYWFKKKKHAERSYGTMGSGWGLDWGRIGHRLAVTGSGWYILRDSLYYWMFENSL